MGLTVPGVDEPAPPPLLGYFPKRTIVPPAWMATLGIREVASVSACLSGGPADWVQAWKHNSWGLFDSPDTAWSVVAERERADFRLYAYRAHALESIDDARAARQVESEAEPLGASFQSIGFDIVSRSAGGFFECSPLSCNLLAEDFSTNAYCLLRSRHEAVELAGRAESLQCEPGPYYVLEVFSAS